MLSYALAIAIAISSLVLFSTAFFMSDLHRQDDFLWSGVGLFYALVLWYCAKNITGAVLLGQAAATILLVSYNWQTLKLRKAIANPEKAGEINNFSVLGSVTGLLKRKKSQAKSTAPSKSETKPTLTEQEIAIPEITSQESTSEEVVDTKDIPTTSAEIPVNDAKAIADKQSTEQSTEETVTDSDVKPVAEMAEAVTPPIKDNIDSQVSKDQETRSQKPLPSETSEIVSPTENQSDLPKESEITPENSAKNSPDNQSKPTSNLDSLETVEVAEILEAVTDESTANRDSDQANVIEVTTTDIKTTNEAAKTVQNPEEKPNSEEV